MNAAPIAVALEIGSKRVFAVAVDWPGWSRSGRGEEQALEALLSYAGRYANAVGQPSLADANRVDVTERLQGGATTDFGAPGEALAADARPLDPNELERQLALLRAAWGAFEASAKAARGHELRTGPRGGGRNLAKMSAHVLEADEAYLKSLGSRAPDDRGAEAIRAAAQAAVTARACGEPLANPSRSKKAWLPRYYLRRAAWHALDHAWELEDRVM